MKSNYYRKIPRTWYRRNKPMKSWLRRKSRRIIKAEALQIFRDETKASWCPLVVMWYKGRIDITNLMCYNSYMSITGDKTWTL